MKEVKTDQFARCIKSRIMTQVIDSVLSIDTFEQQCDVIKGMLQSTQLKDHAKTIGIDPSLSNNDIHEHKCLENIEKLYNQSGKCDKHQKFKDIFEASMASTSEGFADNSPISPRTSSPVKNQVLKNHCVCLLIFYM